jgi:hypothetical protein
MNILENGDLQLYYESGDDIYLDETPLYRLSGMFEQNNLIGNDWDVSTANQLNQLSEADIIMKNVSIDDDGNYEINSDSEVWYYNDYMLNCPVETMVETGSVIFNKLHINI